MGKVLKIEPDSKHGLIKNLSEALELARKGEITNLSLVYDYGEDDIRNYSFGLNPEINLLIDIAKHDILERFPTFRNVSYGDD